MNPTRRQGFLMIGLLVISAALFVLVSAVAMLHRRTHEENRRLLHNIQSEVRNLPAADRSIPPAADVTPATTAR